jgi:hypothetical protein
MNAVSSHFTWTHYRLLLRITSKIKSNFYEDDLKKKLEFSPIGKTNQQSIV